MLGDGQLPESSPWPSTLRVTRCQSEREPESCPGPFSSLPAPGGHHLRLLLRQAAPRWASWVLPEQTSTPEKSHFTLEPRRSFPSCVTLSERLNFPEHSLPSVERGLRCHPPTVLVRTELSAFCTTRREPTARGAWDTPVAGESNEIPDLVGSGHSSAGHRPALRPLFPRDFLLRPYLPET